MIQEFLEDSKKESFSKDVDRFSKYKIPFINKKQEKAQGYIQTVKLKPSKKEVEVVVLEESTKKLFFIRKNIKSISDWESFSTLSIF